ncbi:MAG: hypothetical protein DDT42_02094 [candidate division WS2 bacterium]|uniref:Uncharacterized protein n=1 Tax=Psychracetigena formicireducens TaxID=2986056 RepID=A0A9E2BJ73_PSYF1|nr:hypothetical protein [Candidatus Psychracetigena formicireducens]
MMNAIQSLLDESKKLLFASAVAFLLTFYLAEAQTVNWSDSNVVRLINPAEYIYEHWPKKARFIFKFDNRSSLINQYRVQLFGIKTGVAIGRSEFGLGVVIMPGQLNFTTPEEIGKIERELALRYFDAYYEYRIYKRGNFSLDISSAIGLGRAGFKETNLLNGEETFNFQRIAMIEPGGMAFYKVVPFVSIGAGLGWRQAFARNADFKNKFSAPIWMFRVKIELGQIAKALYLRNRKIKGMRG